jgi:hypothetical protein
MTESDKHIEFEMSREISERQSAADELGVPLHPVRVTCPACEDWARLTIDELACSHCWHTEVIEI